MESAYIRLGVLAVPNDHFLATCAANEAKGHLFRQVHHEHGQVVQVLPVVALLVVAEDAVSQLLPVDAILPFSF